jgi:hypothetical protein
MIWVELSEVGMKADSIFANDISVWKLMHKSPMILSFSPTMGIVVDLSVTPALSLVK